MKDKTLVALLRERADDHYKRFYVQDALLLTAIKALEDGEVDPSPELDQAEGSRRAWGDFQLSEDYDLIPLHCRGYAMASFHAGYSAGRAR